MLKSQKIESQTNGLETLDVELNLHLKGLSHLKNVMKLDMKQSDRILNDPKELMEKRK